MSLDKARKRLIERGLIRREGKAFVVTDEGEAWTDELIDRLKTARMLAG